jgi:hypothetical protein
MANVIDLSKIPNPHAATAAQRAQTPTTAHSIYGSIVVILFVATATLALYDLRLLVVMLFR